MSEKIAVTWSVIRVHTQKKTRPEFTIRGPTIPAPLM
jgi:hypothetical protein